ncbi:TraB/GumN family protein [Ciceribacter sp. L1K23]|uniref:TraB/GumN family protein n=1 Tax=Ciceribacter sp. L1K23 TaxID=2820276 RepID=UPI001B838933|nr:TraB/GumN family protein [Ciceribacter sp. L1K23]MBR0554178.1 TraB/GumN family protein [Ciceribacter sp. L1K23]
MIVSTIEQALNQGTRRVADVILWFMAALHVAMVASLLVVLTFAGSARADDQTCRGRNLLRQLETENKAAFDSLVDEAAEVPNGKGLFWQVEKPGTPPSWLFGTMHVTDPRVLAMPNAARDALMKASTVAIESDEILDEKKAMAAMLMKPELSMFTDGSTIVDHLDDTDAKILEEGLRDRGLSLAAVSRMKPWILAGFVALPACELARKASGASFLDKKIAEDAVAAGKTVKGLETLEEQLAAMGELPLSFHIEALLETLALGDRMQDVMSTMTDLYVSGDIGMTMPMLKAVTDSHSGSDGSYAAFEQRIVTDRNHVMANRSMPILKEGNAFIAVGALHLPGEEGLVELLRKQGFTVSLVN